MKIPEDRMPYEVTINGVKKTYEAGATVADDASVKEIIDNENLFPPKAPDAGKPFDIPIPDPGSTVVANPTLAGTEDSLTGIEIDGTKYAVGGGSGGGALVVHAIENEAGTAEVLDKTWQEIHDAAETSAVICVRINPVVGTVVEYICGVSEHEGEYTVIFIYMASDGNTEDTYTADSATGYPAMSYD